MQFKALFLFSLAAGVFAESTTVIDGSSSTMESRTDTDSRTSHSTSAADAMSSHSTDDRSSSDRSDRSESTRVESGYALTTDASGSTIATYTGTDTKKPKTAALATSTSDSHSSSHTSDHSSSTTGSSSKSSTSSHNLAMATAIPLIGAAAMAGIAFAM